MNNFSILSITPTVFFIHTASGLQQGVDVTLENNGPAVTAELLVRTGSGEVCIRVEPLPSGQSIHRGYIPDLRQALEVEFSLRVGGVAVDQQSVPWTPERHWEIYLTPGSHHDLGYTDLPSNLLREHDRILDDALSFCDETQDFPEESRFRCVIEQGWSVMHFIEHRPPAQVERLVRLIRAGRIEVTALLGNETSELCGHEEQIRLLYPAFRLKRRFGIPIRCAELNDIPGVSWGLASVLAGAGVRYFSAGIPDYYAWGKKIHAAWDEAAVLPRDLPGAFWWQGPDGQRVLFWYCSFGISWGGPWTYEQAERNVPLALANLAQRGYPHDLVMSRCSGGQRDNSPLDVRFSLIARQWNAQWAYPRLIVSTDVRFFEQFERRAGAQLKVLRGDLPNTDYTVGATSSAHETGVNRLAHDELLAAERLAVLAALLGGVEYPAERLAEAYQSTLLFDEHTWGMAHPIGPAQAAGWNQKSQWAYRAALAQDVISKSTNRLADQVGLDGGGYHVVVFNALAQPRTDVVSVPAMPPSACGKPMHWLYPPKESANPPVWVGVTAIGRYLVNLPPDLFNEPFDLLDLAAGRRIPYQVVTLKDPLAARPLAAHNYSLGHTDSASVDLLNFGESQLKELAFIAEDVPALGYKTYRIVPRAQTGEAFSHSLQVGEGVIENRFYKITLDPHSGAVTSLFDKELSLRGREWVDSTAPHGMNQLVTRSPHRGEMHHPQQVTITCGETGPVWASLVVKSSAPGCPQVTQEIVLYEAIKRVDFNNRILRDATPLHEVYFAFPFAVAQPQFRYEASNAIIEPIRDQLPGTNTDAYAVQHWVTVENENGGVVWSSLEAPVVALGKLWPVSVSQAHQGALAPEYGRPFLRDPGEFKDGAIYSYAMISNFRTNFQPVQVTDALFRYRLTTTGQPPAGRDFGWAASSPLLPVCVQGPQAGSLPAAAGFCQVEGAPNVLLLALKAAEDGDGLILRLIETEGRPALATVSLPAYTIEQAFQTNLVEENTGSVWSDRHQVRVALDAYTTVTIRCRGARRWPVAQACWYD